MIARVRVENGQLRLLDPLKLEEGRIYTLTEEDSVADHNARVDAALADICKLPNPDAAVEEPAMTEEELWEEG